MLFAQADDVLFPHEGLSAGEETGVGAQLLGLGQHTVHFLKGQALLVAVFRRPAAGAVHIAGGGGIHQNQPRHVDIVLGCVLLRRLIAPEAALVGRVGQEGLENIGVVLPDQPLGIVGPLAVGDGLKGLALRRMRNFIGDSHRSFSFLLLNRFYVCAGICECAAAR